MKRLVVALLCTPAFAFAEDAAKPAAAAPAMEMPKPGAEHKALKPFFGGSLTWAGKMPAGAMGPGSPEMKTHAKQNCRALYGGFSYLCEFEDASGSGKQALTWKGHFVISWDPAAKTYKSFGVDNFGGIMSLKGELTGKKFVLVTSEPAVMMGQAFQDRLTWDLETMRFTDEHAAPGSSDWKIFEEATFRKVTAF